MPERYVYLSGPITGMHIDEASQWRHYVKQRLARDVFAIDPMRDAVDFSVISKKELTQPQRLENLQHGKQILERNRMDIARCDLVLVNVLGAKAVSIGSVGEMFWADAFRKPVILVREEFHNPHDHGLLNAIAAQWFASLDPAIEQINKIFS